MTEQQAAKFVARLQQEDESLRRDQLTRFDGSAIWAEMTARMAADAVEASKSHQDSDHAA